MSAYTVYLSNGNRLLDLVPLRVDTSTTSLSLQGDSTVPNFGQINPTNLVHMLEHFSNATPPSNPIIGQIWYNSTLQSCSVWNGLLWSSVGGSGSIGPTGPTGPTGPQGIPGTAPTAQLAETHMARIFDAIQELTTKVSDLEAKIAR